MSTPRRSPSDSLTLRARVVNWLLTFAGVEDLPPISDGADMGALDRAKYERRLDLVAGSLSLGRFERDFPDLDIPQIGMQLLDEAYVGSIQRVQLASDQTAQPESESSGAEDLSGRFDRILREIALVPSEVILLTGSPDVGLAFSGWGVYVPALRRQPGHTDFTRFGLAIVGRGQAGHKVFEPWTQLIKSYEKHLGPALVTSPSSNVSGMLDFLWNQRTSIRRYVDLWRAAQT